MKKQNKQENIPSTTTKMRMKNNVNKNTPKAFHGIINRKAIGSLSGEYLKKCSEMGSPLADAEINRRRNKRSR